MTPTFYDVLTEEEEEGGRREGGGGGEDTCGGKSCRNTQFISPSMKGCNGQIDVKSLAAGQGRARHGRATASARGRRQVGRVEECGSQRASEPVELTNEAEDNVIITQPRHGHAFFSKMLAHSSGHSVLGFSTVSGD